MKIQNSSLNNLATFLVFAEGRIVKDIPSRGSFLNYAQIPP